MFLIKTRKEKKKRKKRLQMEGKQKNRRKIFFMASVCLKAVSTTSLRLCSRFWISELKRTVQELRPEDCWWPYSVQFTKLVFSLDSS